MANWKGSIKGNYKSIGRPAQSHGKYKPRPYKEDKNAWNQSAAGKTKKWWGNRIVGNPSTINSNLKKKKPQLPSFAATNPRRGGDRRYIRVIIPFRSSKFVTGLLGWQCLSLFISQKHTEVPSGRSSRCYNRRAKSVADIRFRRFLCQAVECSKQLRKRANNPRTRGSVVLLWQFLGKQQELHLHCWIRGSYQIVGFFKTWRLPAILLLSA